MSMRPMMAAVAAMLLIPAAAGAQVPDAAPDQMSARYTDSAKGVSLDEAIASALAQEPSLRAARAEVDVVRGLRRQAGLRPNPTVSFELRDEPAGTDRQTAAGIEWPLDLFRTGPRATVAQREVEAAEHAAANHARLVAAEARARYGQLLSAIRDLAILDELVTLTRRHHELLRARVEEGAAPPLERDLLEVELRRVEADRQLQAARADVALLELKRILGLGAAEPLTVRETLEAVVRAEAAAPAPMPADIAAIVRQRPDVREAAARVDIAEARIDRARRERLPDVTVFGSYMRMDAGFPQLGFARDGSLERVRGVFRYLAGGAMLTVPLLNRNQGEAAAARAARVSAEASHDAARLAADADIAAARARDEHARAAVALFTGGAQALGRQNLTVVGRTYELGHATVFDVLAEHRRYLDVERAYTQALEAAFDARTALKRGTGDLP